MNVKRLFEKKSALEIVNLALKVAVAIAGGAMLVGSLVDPEAWPKTWSYIATIGLPFVPDLVKKLGYKIGSGLETAYLGFIIPAMVLGIDLMWYENVYILGQPCFDKVVHCLSGVLTVFIAAEVYEKFNHVSRPNRGFFFLYLVAVSALIAVGWETFEFLYDQIAGGHMQELIAPGVEDTMWDMIGAMAFGAVAAVGLILKQLPGRSASKR